MDKKVGLIVLVVVLALGAIGVGYAAWQQTLTINGTVDTANFDVHFNTDAVTVDPDSGDAYLTLANVDIYSFDVALVNGYPGFTGNCTYQIHNDSSIPVIITMEYYDGASWVDWTNGATAKMPINQAKAVVSVTNSGIATDDVMTADSTQSGTMTFDVTGDSTDGAITAYNGTFKVRFVVDQNAS